MCNTYTQSDYVDNSSLDSSYGKLANYMGTIGPDR